MTTPEKAARRIMAFSLNEDERIVACALLAAEARIRVLEEALTNIEGKCADSIGGRINYRAGDLQIIARRALAKGAPQ
jgi:hypothetical protein